MDITNSLVPAERDFYPFFIPPELGFWQGFAERKVKVIAVLGGRGTVVFQNRISFSCPKLGINSKAWQSWLGLFLSVCFLLVSYCPPPPVWILAFHIYVTTNSRSRFSNHIEVGHSMQPRQYFSAESRTSSSTIRGAVLAWEPQHISTSNGFFISKYLDAWNIDLYDNRFYRTRFQQNNCAQSVR